MTIFYKNLPFFKKKELDQVLSDEMILDIGPKTINKIIELVGGYEALSKILNVSKSAISNYKKRGSLPSYAIPIIVKELKSKGVSVDLSEFTKVKLPTNSKTILMIICGLSLIHI